MAAESLGQGVEGHVLILPAADDGGGAATLTGIHLGHGRESRQGAGGGGVDGAVVEADGTALTGDLPHQLQTVGHTEEGVGHGSHVSGFGVAAGQGDGGHEVLHVMPSGDADAGNIQHGGLGHAVFGGNRDHDASLPLVDGGVPAGGVDRIGEVAAGQIPRARKPGHGGGQSLTDTAGVLVPPVEDGGLGGDLTAQKVGLGGNILGHVGVPVEVVGGDVGQRPTGHARSLAHGHELEAGQLHHGEILGGHVLRKGKKGCTDVAPSVDLPRAPPLAGLLQNEGGHGGGGGLSVGAGNGDHTGFGQG